MLWFAAILGVSLGIVAAVISRAVSQRLGKGDFWSRLPELTRELASHSEGDAFLRTYGQLIRLLGAHLFRNALQLGASFAPVIGAVVFCGPWVMERYNSGADELAVHPPRNLRIEVDGVVHTTTAAGSSIVPAPDLDSSGNAFSLTGDFPVDRLKSNQAWCNTEWGRLTMGLLGFKTHPATDATGYLVLRPRCGDVNPLWPFLNDLEFAFYFMIAVASAATGLFLKARAR